MKYAGILTAIALVLLGGHAVAGDIAGEQAAQSLQAAAAKQQAHADIIVLHATASGKGIDSKIGDRERKALKKPPFSAYDSYELLEEEGIFFSKDEVGELELPNKGTLQLQLNEMGKKVDLAVTITKPNKKKFVAANVKARIGKTFFLAGPKYKKGILVLGIRVKPKAPAEPPPKEPGKK